MRKALTLAVRIVAVFVAVVFSFAIAGAAFALVAGPAPSPPAGDGTSVFPALVTLSLFIALVVSLIVLRARGRGWPLAAALGVAIFGLNGVLTYIEAAVFLRSKMPAPSMNGMLVMGAVLSALLAPLAVGVLGRARRPPAFQGDGAGEARRPRAPRAVPAALIGKLGILGALYVALYLSFGYYVAWQNPVLRDYYGGTDPGGFLAMLHQNWVDAPWIFPLQFGRGILWACCLLPLIRQLRRTPAETAFAMALFSSVWSLQLLLPNPYMPPGVRWSHLLETVSSNLLFGFAVGWLLSRAHPASRESVVEESPVHAR